MPATRSRKSATKGRKSATKGRKSAAKGRKSVGKLRGRKTPSKKSSTTCEKSSLSKYAGRPGPPYPANSAGCRGKILKGNDRHDWQSKADKNGVYTWRRIAQ